MQDANRYDLKREYCCGQRCSEQRSEHRAHAAKRDKAHVLVIKLQQPPDAVAYAAAYLKCRALAAGRAADEMSDRS